MVKKKVFALRLNEDLYTAVEQWAADEFRSTNGQLEWIISKALKDARRMSPPKTETEDEEKFCMQMFGHRPVGYMQEVDWVGDDVWFAHGHYIASSGGAGQNQPTRVKSDPHEKLQAFDKRILLRSQLHEPGSFLTQASCEFA